MDAFQIVKQIGSGSFGVVLVAQSKSDDKTYVIKQINLHKLRLEEKYSARKEISVLARLNHPNIVTYYSSFEQNDCLNILMDYCSGGDLHGKIEDRKNKENIQFFPENQIWEWYLQICLGIKHMHDRRILHRDLKSQNIFLTQNGMVKVGDFGISRILDNTFDMARTCVGTPYYLSPEICENKPYDTKTDIWALGCLLHEISVLIHPFQAKNMKTLLMKIIRASYPPLPTVFSSSLRSLVDQQLKLKPKDRPNIDQILVKHSVRKKLEEVLKKQSREHEIELLYAESTYSSNVTNKGRRVSKPPKIPKTAKKEEETKKKSQNSEKSTQNCDITCQNNEKSINNEEKTSPNEKTSQNNEKNSQNCEKTSNSKEATTQTVVIDNQAEKKDDIKVQEGEEIDGEQNKALDKGDTTEESTFTSSEVSVVALEFDDKTYNICSDSHHENSVTCQSKCCRQCGRVMTAHKKQCRKCGVFKKLLSLDAFPMSEEAFPMFARAFPTSQMSAEAFPMSEVSAESTADNFSPQEDQFSLAFSIPEEIEVPQNSFFSTSKAETLRSELEFSMGKETFAKCYEKLLQEGDWLDGETASIFERNPTLCRKFRELLLAECAYNL